MKLKTLMAAFMALTLVGSIGTVFAAEPAAAPAAAAPAKPPVLKVGDMFQEFSIPDGDGKNVSFNADIKGKAKFTALVFMNTSCSACQMEARIMNGLANENKDLKVYGLLVDARGEAAIAGYKERNPTPNIAFLVDKAFTVPPVYGFTYTPAMVIVDKSGKIIESKGGFLASQGEEFAKNMKDLLK